MDDPARGRNRLRGVKPAFVLAAAAAVALVASALPGEITAPAQAAAPTVAPAKLRGSIAGVETLGPIAVEKATGPLVAELPPSVATLPDGKVFNPQFPFLNVPDRKDDARLYRLWVQSCGSFLAGTRQFRCRCVFEAIWSFSFLRRHQFFGDHGRSAVGLGITVASSAHGWCCRRPVLGRASAGDSGVARWLETRRKQRLAMGNFDRIRSQGNSRSQ